MLVKGAIGPDVYKNNTFMVDDTIKSSNIFRFNLKYNAISSMLIKVMCASEYAFKAIGSKLNQRQSFNILWSDFSLQMGRHRVVLEYISACRVVTKFAARIYTGLTLTECEPIWGRDKTAAILLTTFSNHFSRMNTAVLRFKFHRNISPMGQFSNKPVMVQIMTWHREGDKPSSEPKKTSLNDDELSFD